MDTALARPLTPTEHSRRPRFALAPTAAPMQGRGRDRVADGETGCHAPASASFHCARLGDTETSGRTWPTVFMPDGSAYPGDLIEDILEYRALRARMLAGDTVQPQQRSSFATLEERVRSRDLPNEGGRAHVRAYHRFDLSIAAKLRILRPKGSETIDVRIENVSAGGVKISADRELEDGMAVWLVMPRGGSLVVLPSRVAWCRSGNAGLMFAGAPAWR